MATDLQTLAEWAYAEVDEILQSLPPALREKAASVPVTTESRPGKDLEEDGIEPDTLGLFVGVDHGAEEIALSPIPAQVILFLENLWDFAEEDEAIFREEVRRTYLHELGHYLGLDEDDLWDRGLD